MQYDTAFTGLVEVLRERARTTPDTDALAWLDPRGDVRTISCRELDARARAGAVRLGVLGLRPGDRALVAHPPGLDYVIGFLACLYAGVAAVPVPLPRDRRGLERVWTIATDSAATVALTDGASLAELRAQLAELGLDTDAAGGPSWESTDGIGTRDADDWTPVGSRPDSLAFLQYTSGSTAAPKGVMVSHLNLVHNSSVIAGALEVAPGTKGVSWLPPYHDMGLIGGILQPLYSGFPCLLMSPMTFLHRPFAWLEAISTFGATSSAGPDFAYAECVRRVTDEEIARLDLSSWRHALVGADVVRPQTLDAFAERFAPAGFDRSAFLPCYGLAEATLFVTGVKAADAPVERRLDRAELARGAAADGGVDGLRSASCGWGAGEDEIAVVDPATGRALDAERVGEVWVSGPTVADGYWRNEEATENVFHARRADDPGRTWLRTGDLGFHADGGLYITGRLKDLIVVRGTNHYPQDIEDTAARVHPSLRPGRAAAFAVEGDDQQVVLVQEASPGRMTDEERAALLDEIRAAVAAGHGLALHSVLLVRPGSVPRTSSGKVRRRECAQIYARGELTVLARSEDTETGARSGSGSRAPLEGPGETIAALAAAVLGIDQRLIDPARPLVAQGLDSLTAVRLRARLHSELRLDVPLRDLLAAATVEELAAGRPADADAGTDPLPRLGDHEAAPLSPGQERLWLLAGMGAGAAYHTTGLVELPGDADTAAVAVAIQLLVDRHEPLRTGVRQSADGRLEPAPVPPGECRIEMPVHEVDGLEELETEVRGWSRRPFDLERPPLLRAALYRVGGTQWRLAVCAHHIAVDGWSLSVLAQEFAAAYEELKAGRVPSLDSMPVRYGDFAVWQRVRSSRRDVEYWRRTLDGASAPELAPFAPAAGPGASAFDGARLPFDLPAPLTAGLREVAATSGGTLFMALLAGFTTVLGRWADADDVLVGTVWAGRERPELMSLAGFFADVLPLRVEVGGDPSLRELLTRTRSVCLDAYAHREATFEQIVQHTRRPGEAARLRPLVRHLLVLQDGGPLPSTAGTGQVTVLPAEGARFDLELELVPRPDGGLSGTLSYDTALFGSAVAVGLLESLGRLLAEAVRLPDRPLSGLLLTDREQTRLTEFSGADSRPVTAPAFPAWFEAQVDAAPEAIAVVDPDGGVTTYRELDIRANRIAHHLRSRGVGPEDRVAVHLPRGADLSAAVVGVLKAGAVYQPLDPSQPGPRLSFLLEDGAPALVLTSSALAARLSLAPERTALIDTCQEIADAPGHRPRVSIAPGNAAYVLHTSGSTGRPKGVVNTHAGLVNRLDWARARHGLDPSDRVLHKTPIGFDVSLWELLLPLTTGAALVHARQDGHHDPAYMHRLIDEERVTTCHFVPSMLRAFLDAAGPAHPSLRLVVCSGERLTPDLAARFHEQYPGVALHNLYGPTEAAVDVTAHTVAPGAPSVPIGAPVPGVDLHVLDRQLRPQPVGAVGELFIGGPQVARGYHQRPGLTAQRFVPHPFSPGARLYATGDRARWLPDGALEYLGRRDDQVKIRGQRIEPGEVEAALLTHPQVTAAAVVVRQEADGEPFLAGYVTGPPAADGTGPEPRELRAYLAERLPAALVPTGWRRLEALPLTASGKVDRSALPPVTAGEHTGGEYTAPRDAVERILSEIFAEVLGLPRVGIHDRFFDLGGHSLLAVQVANRIANRFGTAIAVGDLLLAGQSVAELGELVGQQQLTEAEAGDTDELLAMLADMTEEQAAEWLSRLEDDLR
ncbi:non-ribosomal peptide synthetase [Streptomyces lavendulae subsp. lavendulae]|uniref:non-ribosomal peptide synthetase n=1 Tax=Streptomyces lavendulae TaxID=1914 RepID=UPI0024A0979B|nr:non-ribosomal peptide synthetase [Streptomyces lavendulae]GLV84817.1 non-ribosomal peptide synthetase [Streptomyces lavendulae subsp. lavendulae]